MLFKKLIFPFYLGFVIVCFVNIILIVLPIILVLSIGRTRTTRKFIFFIVKVGAKVWLLLAGMYPKVTGRPLSVSGKYIIVGNHISYLDSIVIFAAIPYPFLPLGKIEFSHIPLFGLIYKQITILVDRSSIHNRARSMKKMMQVLDDGCSIFIFPEGTFNETGKLLKEFYDGAFHLAIRSGTPILPIIFADTENRWHHSAWWKLSAGRNRVEFLEPIHVSHLAPADVAILKENVYTVMENALLKYKNVTTE